MAGTDTGTVGREWRALAWAAAAALLVIVWIARPVGVGILLGTLIAFTLQPFYERLKPRLGPSGAALATVIATTLGLLTAFGGLGWLFVARGAALTRQLIADLEAGGGASVAVDRVARVSSRFGVTRADLDQRIRSAAEMAAARAASIAQEIVAASALSLLALFFAMLTMHFILRNWEGVTRGAQQTLPLRPEYTHTLLEEFRRVGRTTLLGTVLTGLAQGLIASVGYWICGVPEAVFFGAMTAVASLIPAVGTLLVWVPAGVVLILLGHVLGGVGVLVWGGALIVGASDYLIRPRLIGGEMGLPSLVTFTALLGGVEVFGLKGLVLGPVAMALAVAVLRLYAREAREGLR